MYNGSCRRKVLTDRWERLPNRRTKRSLLRRAAVPVFECDGVVVGSPLCIERYIARGSVRRTCVADLVRASLLLVPAAEGVARTGRVREGGGFGSPKCIERNSITVSG